MSIYCDLQTDST